MSLTPYVSMWQRVLKYAFVTACLIFSSVQPGDPKDKLLLHVKAVLLPSYCCCALTTAASFQCPTATMLRSTSLCDAVVGTSSTLLSAPLAMHSHCRRCRCSPSQPHSRGETVWAPSAHQIPAGPLWSTEGEFMEQPLVVPTQQPSFIAGLMKPDNIPSALALLFSQLNAKRQFKASPRCKY